MRTIFFVFVTCIASAQTLRVDAPSKTTQAHVWLTGTATDSKKIAAIEWENQDGLRGFAEPSAKWTSHAPLVPGHNEFAVTVRYSDGRSEQQRITVEREGAAAAMLLQDNAGTVWFRGNLVPYRNVDGDAVVEGDIIVGRVKDIQSKGDRAEAFGITAAARRWTNNTVVYLLDPGLPAASRTKFLQAVDFWRNNSPIRFVERTNEVSYQRIQRLTPDEGACFSAIGMGTGETTMRLPDSCPVSAIIHEMGHSIGLYHEQTRTDRDRALRIRLDQIWLDQTSQYAPQTGNGADIGPYDFGSNMQYAQFSFARAFDPVFTTIPRGINVAEPQATAADIEAVRAIYGVATSEVTVTTNPPGLQITVDGQSFASPRRFNWAAGSTHTIAVENRIGAGDLRYQFGRWSNDGPRTQTVTANANDRTYIAHMVRQCRVAGGIPTPADGGTFTLTPYSPDGFYTCDSEITFEATPAEGFQFARWSFTGPAGRNPATVRIGGAIIGIRPIFQRRPLVTITSDPPGRQLIVDNVSWTTPVSFDWTPGSQHRVSAANQTLRRIQYRFDNWSDGETAAHAITAPDGEATFTATFKTFYRLSTSTLGTGTITVNPNIADRLYESGTSVQVTANPGANASFRNWFGGFVTGTQPTATITMSDERFVGANFLAITTPTVTLLQPATITAGANPFLLRAAGTNLIEGLTQIRVNNNLREGVRFSGTTQIEIPLTAQDLSTAGTLAITATTTGAAAVGSINLTVAQRPANCDLSVGTPSATQLDSGGGSIIAPVELAAGCAWNPTTTDSWIELVPAPLNGGNGFVNVYAAANPGVTSRSGTVRIGGRTITVQQAGIVCTPVLSQTEIRLPVAGGRATVNVGLYSKECAWNRVVESEWITASGNFDAGFGVLTVSAEANSTGSERMGSVTIAGSRITVRQVGESAPPVVESIVNEASRQPGLAPQGRFVLTGRALANAPASGNAADLGGTQVLFGEIPARLFSVSATRLEGQVPTGAAASVVVKVGALSSAAAAAVVEESAPGIYVSEDGRAVGATNEDGGENSPENPSAVGSTLAVVLTGQGSLDPAVADGEASPEGVKPVLPVAVKLGGTDCEVVSAEMIAGEIGKLRVRVKVPEGVATGDQPLIVAIGGRDSNSAVVAIGSN